MFANAKNTLAKAILRYNKEKELYKVVVAFNVTEKTEKGKWKFPPQSKCAYVSGDFGYENLQEDFERIIENAKKSLRTDNIVVVD